MTSDGKDVFGVGGLANPTYAVPQHAAIEQTFMTGNSETAPPVASEPETTEDLLKRRIAEVEQRVGCSIFPSSSHDQDHDRDRDQDHDQDQDFETDDRDPGHDRDRDFADPSPSTSAPRPMSGSGSGGSGGSSSSELKPSGSTLTSTEGFMHTEEAMRRDKLTTALSALSIGTDGFLDADRLHDRKLMMIEEIEDLVTLFRDDGEDVSRIHIPDPTEKIEVVQSTLTILKRHNDRRRYGTLADECIMLAATSLETLCDGKRDWLGFKPDLSGWSQHVRAKLRRMHHDTSQIASSFMNDYNIGPGMRLMLELVPNVIMYARNKSATNAATSPTSADPTFDDAVRRLRGDHPDPAPSSS